MISLIRFAQKVEEYRWLLRHKSDTAEDIQRIDALGTEIDVMVEEIKLSQ